MKIVMGLLVAAAIVVAGALGFAYSGLLDVRASSPHSGLVNWYLSTVSHASIERRAKDVTVPDLTGDALVRAGVNDFEAMCVVCHGAPGKPPAAVGQGLNPAAPDLAESAAHMSPAELFWVTKNGIRMTGMPAWGATHDDNAIWPVVAFVSRLPDLDAERYQSLLTSAAGIGHHAGSDDHGEHDHGAVEPSGSAAMDADHGHPMSPSAIDDKDSPPPAEADDHDDGHDHEHE